MMTQPKNPLPADPIFVHSVVDDAGLNPSQFRVYAHIARRDGEDGAFSGVLGMAKHCQLHHETVREALRELLARRMIEAEERRGQTTVYRRTHPDTWLNPSGNKVGVGNEVLPPNHTPRKIIEVPPTSFTGGTPLEIGKAKVLPESTPKKESLPPPPPVPPDGGASASPPGGGIEKKETVEQKAERERRQGLSRRVVRMMFPSGRHDWRDPEKTAIGKLNDSPHFAETVPIMELFYALPEEAFPKRRGDGRREDFRRQSFITLLRYWWDEVKKAEAFFEKNPNWRKMMIAKLQPAAPAQVAEPEPLTPEFIAWLDKVYRRGDLKFLHEIPKDLRGKMRGEFHADHPGKPIIVQPAQP